ncbi:hypothetical protein [uncultured Friedmanniella sp.]|uniref:hypothetical protein n=1 Tax=uncultured Friedmanniella sp. TaxID=335381 RepID=UPI0035CA86A1
MPGPDSAESRLPALLNGASAVVTPSPWWRRGAVSSAVGAVGLFSADVAGSGDVWGVGGAALVALAVGLAHRGRPPRRRYPHLGRALAAWRSAGATPAQLEILDEAHRIRALTPPVGYRDRRTVINPLADAFAVFTSPAWRDPWLADHQLTIDPVAEAAEVIDHVHRVTALLAEVRAAAATVPPRSAARRTYTDYERALLGALDDGLRRARALSAYRGEVARLARLLEVSRALPQAEAFADRVLDVVSESARQDLAARHLDDSRVQLRELESGLREITDLLTTTPELPVAPRRPQ